MSPLERLFAFCPKALDDLGAEWVLKWSPAKKREIGPVIMETPEGWELVHLTFTRRFFKWGSERNLKGLVEKLNEKNKGAPPKLYEKIRTLWEKTYPKEPCPLKRKA